MVELSFYPSAYSYSDWDSAEADKTKGIENTSCGYKLFGKYPADVLRYIQYDHSLKDASNQVPALPNLTGAFWGIKAAVQNWVEIELYALLQLPLTQVALFCTKQYSTATPCNETAYEEVDLAPFITLGLLTADIINNGQYTIYLYGSNYSSDYTYKTYVDSIRLRCIYTAAGGVQGVSDGLVHASSLRKPVISRPRLPVPNRGIYTPLISRRFPSVHGRNRV